MGLLFEWDENKADENYNIHGVSFEEAKTVFNDPFSITIYDPDHSIDEDRYIDIGFSLKGRLIVVSYTERKERIRIINSRNAEKKEQKTYFMKRKDNDISGVSDMRDEYDFSDGERGKHYQAYRKGHSVKIRKNDGSVEEHHFTEAEGSVMLDPDVKEHFPDSKSVNKVLREYIEHH